MIEMLGDLFDPPVNQPYGICLTTNGQVNRYGNAVMGRGVAAQAKARWPFIAGHLGDMLKENGNHCHRLTWSDSVVGRIYLGEEAVPFHIFSFPVKASWKDQQARLELIEQSCREMQAWMKDLPNAPVVLPRPGCGNGNREWSEIKPILQRLLPEDRWVVVEKFL